MGQTGVTEFLHIGRMAHAFHVDTVPHASTGTGILMAASLHATATLKRVLYHEYQHSIVDKNLVFVTGDIACAARHYTLPSGPGHGVEPHPDVFSHVVAA